MHRESASDCACGYITPRAFATDFLFDRSGGPPVERYRDRHGLPNPVRYRKVSLSGSHLRFGDGELRHRPDLHVGSERFSDRSWSRRPVRKVFAMTIARGRSCGFWRLARATVRRLGWSKGRKSGGRRVDTQSGTIASAHSPQAEFVRNMPAGDRQKVVHGRGITRTKIHSPAIHDDFELLPAIPKTATAVATDLLCRPNASARVIRKWIRRSHKREPVSRIGGFPRGFLP